METLLADGKQILDVCCGSRMFWFDKADPRAMYIDIRDESYVQSDRVLEVRPDLVADFRELPFADASFGLVVFDPPHFTRAGEKGWQRQKFGVLNKDTWRDDLRAGFSEAFRVLRPLGVLVFKWNEMHIPVKEILSLTDQKPAFGHRSGKRGNTHWICFMKGEK